MSTTINNRLHAIHEHFAGRFASGVAPALYYAVSHRGRIIADGGFGGVSTAPGAPAPTAATAFRIASCTKSFTSAAIAHAVEASRLSWDARITDYLPAQASPATRRALDGTTLLDLLSMRAGLVEDNEWADRQESLTRTAFEQLLASEGGVALSHAPRGRFEYSNLGFALAGYMLEQATGETYLSYVRENVLTPLGLSGTDFVRPSGVESAQGYHRRGHGSGTGADTGTGGQGSWEFQPFSRPGYFSPIGGLFSTAHDVARWSWWLASAYHEGDAWNTEDMQGPLSAESRRLLQTPHTSREGHQLHSESYALGLGTVTTEQKQAYVGHSGGYPGFSTHMRWHAESGYAIFAAETASYTGVTRPAFRALRHLVEGVAFDEHPDSSEPGSSEPDALLHSGANDWASATSTFPLSEATREASAAINASVEEGHLTSLLPWLADNVLADSPLTERNDQLARVLATTGKPDVSRARILGGHSAGHLVWSIPCQSMDLRCEARMTPLLPSRVQALSFAAAPNPRSTTTP